jgi:peptidoglycan hydrolase CwlO-like protein
VKRLREGLTKFGNLETKMKEIEDYIENFRNDKFNLEYECKCLEQENKDLKRDLQKLQENEAEVLRSK